MLCYDARWLCVSFSGIHWFDKCRSDEQLLQSFRRPVLEYAENVRRITPAESGEVLPVMFPVSLSGGIRDGIPEQIRSQSAPVLDIITRFAERSHILLFGSDPPFSDYFLA